MNEEIKEFRQKLIQLNTVNKNGRVYPDDIPITGRINMTPELEEKAAELRRLHQIRVLHQIG